MAAVNNVILESGTAQEIYTRRKVVATEEKADKRSHSKSEEHTARQEREREVRKCERLARAQRSEEYSAKMTMAEDHTRASSEPVPMHKVSLQPTKPPRPRMYRDSTIEEPGFKDYENVPSRAPPNGHTPPSNGHTPNIPPSNGHIETKTRGSISGHCRVGNSRSRGSDSPGSDHQYTRQRSSEHCQRTLEHSPRLRDLHNEQHRQRSNGFSAEHSASWQDNPTCHRKYSAPSRTAAQNEAPRPKTHSAPSRDDVTHSAPLPSRGDISVFNKKTTPVKTRPDSPVRKAHVSADLLLPIEVPVATNTSDTVFSKTRMNQHSGRRRRLKESPPRYPPPPPRGKSSAEVVQALSNKLRRETSVGSPAEKRHSRRRSWDIMMQSNGDTICSTQRTEAEGQSQPHAEDTRGHSLRSDRGNSLRSDKDTGNSLRSDMSGVLSDRTNTMSDRSATFKSAMSIGSVDLSDISTMDRKEIIAILRRERESLLELKQYKERERRRRKESLSSGSDTRHSDRYSEVSGMSGLSLSSIDNCFTKEGSRSVSKGTRLGRQTSEGNYCEDISCQLNKKDTELARRLQEEESLKARLEIKLQLASIKPPPTCENGVEPPSCEGEQRERSVSVDGGVERSKSAGNLRPALNRINHGESLDCMYSSQEQYPYSERPVDCPTTPTPQHAMLPPGCDAIRSISGSPVNTNSEPLSSPSPVLHTPYRRRSSKKKNKDKCAQQ